MTNVIDELHMDHINFSKVLNLLSKQLEYMRSDGTPDYILMQDILDYIKNYPEYIHHPKEDVAFRVFSERHHELDEEIAELSKEHAAMGAMTKHLLEEIDGIARNATVISKEALEREIAEYLEYQTQHMNKEETKVFPTLKEKLTPEEFKRIEDSLPSKEDPLFGEVVQLRYQVLCEHILDR